MKAGTLLVSDYTVTLGERDLCFIPLVPAFFLSKNILQPPEATRKVSFKRTAETGFIRLVT